MPDDLGREVASEYLRRALPAISSSSATCKILVMHYVRYLCHVPCAESSSCAACNISVMRYLEPLETLEPLENFLGVHLLHSYWAQKPWLRTLLRGDWCRSWNCEMMVVDLCAISASCILHLHPALCANSPACTLCTICVGLRSRVRGDC